MYTLLDMFRPNVREFSMRNFEIRTINSQEDERRHTYVIPYFMLSHCSSEVLGRGKLTFTFHAKQLTRITTLILMLVLRVY
jgi:hypothetical protein